jgi:hypothetical protein
MEDDMKKINKEIAKLVSQAKKVMDQLEAMKPLYSELDKITDALVEMNGAGQVEDIIIVDNFSAKNTVFKTTSVKRFELKLNKKVA